MPKPKSDIETLLVHLENRAKELEKPHDVLLPEGALHQQWHCESRAAGIRDAIRSIKIQFGLPVT